MPAHSGGPYGPGSRMTSGKIPPPRNLMSRPYTRLGLYLVDGCLEAPYVRVFWTKKAAWACAEAQKTGDGKRLYTSVMVFRRPWWRPWGGWGAPVAKWWGYKWTPGDWASPLGLTLAEAQAYVDEKINKRLGLWYEGDSDGRGNLERYLDGRKRGDWK